MNTVFRVMLVSVILLCGSSPLYADSQLYAEKKVYQTNESIVVYYSGAPGRERDWISIVPFGTADNQAGTYQYLPVGLAHGSLVFAPQYPGRYEVRAYYNYSTNGYLVAHRSAFTVADDPYAEPERRYDESPAPGGRYRDDLLIYTGEDRYHPNESITVYFNQTTGLNSDWINIVSAGTPDNYGGTYQYLPAGQPQGSLVFAPQPPGRYEARVYYNYRRNGYLVSARYPFTVEPYHESPWRRDNSRPERKKRRD